MAGPERRAPLALGILSYLLFFLIVPVILYNAVGAVPGRQKVHLLCPAGALRGAVDAWFGFCDGDVRDDDPAVLDRAIGQRGSQGAVGKPLRRHVAFVWQRDGRLPDLD